MRDSLSISLPPSMKRWVEEQSALAGYATVSEFLRELLREEQERRLRRQIDENLHQALESGASTPMTAADWDRIRREGRKRIAKKRRQQ